MRRMRFTERHQYWLLALSSHVKAVDLSARSWCSEAVRSLRRLEKAKGWTPTKEKTDLETYQEQKRQIQEKAFRRRKTKEGKLNAKT